jgi:hypothetical protein
VFWGILCTFLFPDSLTKWAPLLTVFCTLPDLRVPEMLILDDFAKPHEQTPLTFGISAHF